jgi:hypothetical protein
MAARTGLHVASTVSQSRREPCEEVALDHARQQVARNQEVIGGGLAGNGEPAEMTCKGHPDRSVS